MSASIKNFGELLRSKGELRIRACTEEILSLYTPIERNKNVQGGCTDGERYHYQVFMRRDDESNQENNEVRIAKIDLETGEIVKLSDNLSLNHANDITYNKKLDRLILCHNKPNRERLSVICPNTLTVERTVELEVKVFGISYIEQGDCYVVGISGGKSFCFLNADFSVIDGKIYAPTPLTDKYVTQGICTDDSFIYFVFWDGRTAKHDPDNFQNTIAVYALDGEFVGFVDFNVGVIEPENLGFYKGELYVAFGDEGMMRLYRMTPEI